jgi:hypothetical protein
MRKLEYKTVALEFSFGLLEKTYPDLDTELNSHAADGWRLVQVLEPTKGLGETSKFILVLERESA